MENNNDDENSSYTEKNCQIVSKNQRKMKANNAENTKKSKVEEISTHIGT